MAAERGSPAMAAEPGSTSELDPERGARRRRRDEGERQAPSPFGTAVPATVQIGGRAPPAPQLDVRLLEMPRAYNGEAEGWQAWKLKEESFMANGEC
mmetsp:Transcript_99892/g.322035  ORF Transcript_99892/g.322035 Transcript_99892/m.322035 type:complete len:97 (-) Transcript_99892:19-309(-)